MQMQVVCGARITYSPSPAVCPAHCCYAEMGKYPFLGLFKPEVVGIGGEGCFRMLEAPQRGSFWRAGLVWRSGKPTLCFFPWAWQVSVAHSRWRHVGDDAPNSPVLPSGWAETQPAGASRGADFLGAVWPPWYRPPLMSIRLLRVRAPLKTASIPPCRMAPKTTQKLLPSAERCGRETGPQRSIDVIRKPQGGRCIGR